MLTITAPASATDGGIDFKHAPTPLAELLSDRMLVDDSLTPFINGGEAASFLDFLVRAGRLGAAIYLAWSWAENDEDAHWEVSDDCTTLTVFNDVERVATLTDPNGVTQYIGLR